jgi:hypothetical protein
MNDGNEVIYRLDDDDLIVATDGGWDASGLARGGATRGERIHPDVQLVQAGGKRR